MFAPIIKRYIKVDKPDTLGSKKLLGHLKEAGIIVIKWIPVEEMMAEIFTKNLLVPLFEKPAKKIMGE